MGLHLRLSVSPPVYTHSLSLSLSLSLPNSLLPVPSRSPLHPVDPSTPFDSISSTLWPTLISTCFLQLRGCYVKKKKTAGDPNENEDEDKKELNQDHVEQKSRVES